MESVRELGRRRITSNVSTGCRQEQVTTYPAAPSEFAAVRAAVVSVLETVAALYVAPSKKTSAVVHKMGGRSPTCALAPKLLGRRHGFDSARRRGGGRRVTSLGLSDLSPHGGSMNDSNQRKKTEEEVELHDDLTGR